MMNIENDTPFGIHHWAYSIGTCEASWFGSILNRTFHLRFDLYCWSDSKNESSALSIVIRKETIGGG